MTTCTCHRSPHDPTGSTSLHPKAIWPPAIRPLEWHDPNGMTAVWLPSSRPRISRTTMMAWPRPSARRRCTPAFVPATGVVRGAGPSSPRARHPSNQEVLPRMRSSCTPTGSPLLSRHCPSGCARCTFLLRVVEPAPRQEARRRTASCALGHHAHAPAARNGHRLGREHAPELMRYLASETVGFGATMPHRTLSKWRECASGGALWAGS